MLWNKLSKSVKCKNKKVSKHKNWVRMNNQSYKGDKPVEQILDNVRKRLVIPVISIIMAESLLIAFCNIYISNTYVPDPFVIVIPASGIITPIFILQFIVSLFAVSDFFYCISQFSHKKVKAVTVISFLISTIVLLYPLTISSAIQFIDINLAFMINNISTTIELGWLAVFCLFWLFYRRNEVKRKYRNGTGADEVAEKEGSPVIHIGYGYVIAVIVLLCISLVFCFAYSFSVHGSLSSNPLLASTIQVGCYLANLLPCAIAISYFFYCIRIRIMISKGKMRIVFALSVLMSFMVFSFEALYTLVYYIFRFLDKIHIGEYCIVSIVRWIWLVIFCLFWLLYKGKCRKQGKTNDKTLL